MTTAMLVTWLLMAAAVILALGGYGDKRRPHTFGVNFS